MSTSQKVQEQELPEPARTFSAKELAEVLLEPRSTLSLKLKAIQRLNEFLTSSQTADEFSFKLMKLNLRQLVPPIVDVWQADPAHPCRIIAFRALSLLAHRRELHTAVLALMVPIFTKVLSGDERGTLYDQMSIDSLYTLSSSSAAVLLMTQHGAMQSAVSLLRHHGSEEWLWRLPCMRLIGTLLNTKIGRVEAQSGGLRALLLELGKGDHSQFSSLEIGGLKALTKDSEVWIQHGI